MDAFPHEAHGQRPQHGVRDGQLSGQVHEPTERMGNFISGDQRERMQMPSGYLRPGLAPLSTTLEGGVDDIFMPPNYTRAYNATTIAGAAAKSLPPVPCVVCGEEYEVRNLSFTDCGHWHCSGCFKTNARIALSSEPFTPAKCCHVISPYEFLRAGVITDKELSQYNGRMEELTNPHSKLYCWGEGCNKYIPLESRKRRIGQCGHCGRRTCKSCWSKSHFGPCDKAKMEAVKLEEDQIVHLAELKGWKRCPNCLRIVQKHGGCNHIQCRCGQNFCYLCGQILGDYPHNCENGLRDT